MVIKNKILLVGGIYFFFKDFQNACCLSKRKSYKLLLEKVRNLHIDLDIICFATVIFFNYIETVIIMIFKIKLSLIF